MRSLVKPTRLSFTALMTSAMALVCATAEAQPAANTTGGSPVTMSPIYSPGDPQPSQSALSAARPTGPVALGPVDQALYRQAFDAANRGDWRAARLFAAQGSEPVAKQIVEWRALLDDRSGASFADIATFLAQNPNWPRQDAIIMRAERIMPPDLSPAQVVAWYGKRTPATGVGSIRLGEALIAVGRTNDGHAAIRDGWVRNSFTPTEENQILLQHSAVLSQANHQARLAHFLSRNDVEGAKRQMERVDSQTRVLADTRLKLSATPSLLDRLTGNLDPALRSDPALIFDSARALRRTGKDEEAWTAMLTAPSSQKTPLIAPDQWWTERHIMARDALKAGKPDLAYQLVSGHGLNGGNGLAEAEFFSGWLALRYLNKPAAALDHFQALAKGVRLPISRARAHYWIGRAQEALNKQNDAAISYQKAANDSGTYYGQLALTRIQASPVLHIPNVPVDTKAGRNAFENDDRVRAMRVFGDLGERNLLRVFALHLAREYEKPAQFAMLTELVAKLDDPFVTLRIAKQASYKDAMLFSYLNPVIDLPTPPKGVNVEPALVLGLTRQESEFDSGATSSAGALGLMQMMPASARQTARAHGITYRASKLTDPSYNMQLGMAHLSDSVRQWGGSYILALAAYNAGPGAAKNWIATYGDPRSTNVDPIDWIELIPYGETRNYVQRVIENVEVYRNRLAGSDQRLMILDDLHRPNAPPPVKVLNIAMPPSEVPVPQPAPKRTDAAKETTQR